ncbi:MAG: chemotaxis protein CheW [Planctomycetota bacterium]
MAEFPLHDDGDLDDDPELLAAMAAAFGEEAIESTSEATAADQSDAKTLQNLVSQLDGAIESLGDAVSNDPENTSTAIASSEETRYVIFEIAEQLAAFPLSGITEIERLPNITPLPRTPDWCLGIANVRGEIVSVTDLATLTGAQASGDLLGQKVIIVHSQKHNATTALVVDRVIGIRAFSEGITKRPDDLKAPLAAFAPEIVRANERHILLIQPDELLSHPDMQPFMQD